jgi:hypothetical protein
MKRVGQGLVLAVVVALLWGPLAVQAQEPPAPYRPLSNGEMAPEVWAAWSQTFAALTGKQKAEVVRRHINSCLETLTLAEDQRLLVKDLMAKFVTEEMYSQTDPAKRAAAQKDMQPQMRAAQAVLGDDIFQTVFLKKPPISVLEAVKNDPAFR